MTSFAYSRYQHRLTLLLVFIIVAFLSFLVFKKSYVWKTSTPYTLATLNTIAQLDKGSHIVCTAEFKKPKDHPEVTIKRVKRVQFVHQSWKTANLPPRFKHWSKSWRKCFPNAKHILWTDEDNKNLVVKHYPWFLARYQAFPANIYRADVSRYLYLYHYGGIYTDLDNECLNPFEHLLINTTMTFGKMNIGINKEGYVQNSFMYSEPRHPLWMELLIKLMNTSNQGTADKVTGPEVLVRTLDAYRARFPGSENGIAFYPARYFNPFSWSTNKLPGCKMRGAMSDTDLKICRSHFAAKSYVVQYHTHVWG